MADAVLELSVADGVSGPVITMSGEADLTNHAQLDELIIAQLSRGIKRLAVDAAELRFIDSMAVRTLLIAALTLNDRGGGLILLRPQRPVARMLALLGADRVITINTESRTAPAPEGRRESAL